MKKQMAVIALALLGCTATIQSAGVAVMAYMQKFPETITVGKSIKVNAHFASIEDSKPAAGLQDEGYVSDQDEDNEVPVVHLIEKSKGKWEIKAINPGQVTVILQKDLAGRRHKKRECTHVLTVVAAGKNAQQQKQQAAPQKKAKKASTKNGKATA